MTLQEIANALKEKIQAAVGVPVYVFGEDDPDEDVDRSADTDQGDQSSRSTP